MLEFMPAWSCTFVMQVSSLESVLQVRGWKNPDHPHVQGGLSAPDTAHQDLQASKRKLAALEVSCKALFKYNRMKHEV